MLRNVSPARWLFLCVALLAAAFLSNTLYARHVAAKIDTVSASVAENSGASIVYLARVTDDIRLVTERVRADSAPDDRAAVRAWLDDMERATASYRATPDYPGERDLYALVEARRQPFLAAVDLVLSAERADQARDISRRQLNSAADGLAAAVDELTRFNADHLAAESAAITKLRHQATAIFLGIHAATLVLALLGLAFGSAASRQHVALMEKTSRAAQARAEELEMFAGRVAHDLRAPLSVIQMQSGLAQRTGTVESMKHAMDRVVRQGTRMAEIIESLLAFARAGAPPEGGTAEIVEVVGEVVAENKLIANGSKIDFVVESIPHAKVAASDGVLDIILSNLVRNATKYIGDGRDGMRRIVVRARELRGMVHFEVEDTGPGLPPGTERAVFEPFVRAAKTSASGIGLGLATVKRLVEAHRGRVGVDSRPDRGCRFWFDLPRVMERTNGATEHRTPATRRDSSERRVGHRDPWA